MSQLENKMKDEWLCWENSPVDFREHEITFTVQAAKRMESMLVHHQGVRSDLDFFSKINKAGLDPDIRKKIDLFRKNRNMLVHKENYNKFQDEERKEVITRCLEIFLMLDINCSCKFNDEQRHFTLNINLPDVTMFFLTPIKEVFAIALTLEIKRMFLLRALSRPWVKAWIKPLLGFALGWRTGECVEDRSKPSELLIRRRSELLQEMVNNWLDVLQETMLGYCVPLEDIIYIMSWQGFVASWLGQLEEEVQRRSLQLMVEKGSLQMEFWSGFTQGNVEFQLTSDSDSDSDYSFY